MYEKLNRFEQIVFDACSVILVVFYSYAAVIQPMATQYHRGVYIIITYFLVFLLYKSKSKIMRVVDYILIFLSLISIGYWMFMFETINYRTGAETSTDMVFAIIGVLVGIELARRVVGKVFVFLGIIMLTYGVYGYLAPDLVSHAGAPFTELCISIFYKSDGVFGIMANVLATYVILFVLFGAYLEKCGAQKFFIDWPLAAVGHTIGGPAKVSVIASGLFWFHFRISHCQYCFNRHVYYSHDEKSRIQTPCRRRYRTCRFHRRNVHAPDYGRRRIHHGRVDRSTLF